ncbi:MAG: helix-turn-helix domain-containing protein [Planctomycetota bacterium]
MANIFYSLKEVMEKLGKSEQQIQELVQQGKLRQFHDGANLMFKADEVNALVAQPADIGEQELEMVDTAPITEESAIELAALDETGEISLASDVLDNGSSEIDLTEADTQLRTQGINVLGESSELPVTDDTLGETKIEPGTAAGIGQSQSLEQIEEDVNLDSFGSGSGLLDLSLQADDTSLGADILEDIYSGEGAPDASPRANGMAQVADLGAEADQILAMPETEQMPLELAREAPAGTVTTPPAAVVVEVTADAQSNAFGIMLFVPFVAVIYTGIIAAAAFKGIRPAILTRVQGLVWYIAGGAAVLGLLIMCVGFMVGRPAAPKAKKAQKTKKPGKEKKK